MKKFLMLASLLACMATITFAEDDEEAQPRAPSIPKVLVLQRYDELQNYNGYDGVVFQPFRIRAISISADGS